MEKTTSKRLSEIKNEFERGVFNAVYRSRKQKINRVSAASILVFKHVLRGTLFSWPLYMLAYAFFVLPDMPLILSVVFIVPGIYVSWVILSRGVREDYENLVNGYILRSGYLGRLLFHGKS